MTTRWPIVEYRSGYVLRDREGQRLSFHRTKSGALRARRALIEKDMTDESSIYTPALGTPNH